MARAAAATLALAALMGLALACASEPRPWKVESGDERRFGQARKACEMLTDEPGQFDRCMKRRGFRREYPLGL